jgi:hypothetical protein
VVSQAIGGGLEELGEEAAAFAEDAAQDCRRVPASPCGQPMAGYLAPLGFGNGEHELAVGDGVATWVAIHSAVWRVRRWWQAGQMWRGR